MEDKDAVPVTHPALTVYRRLEEQAGMEEQADNADKRLANLAGNTDWVEMEKFIDGIVRQLESMNNIEPTDTIESIGFRYLAVNTAISYLKLIRNLPGQLAEGVQSGGTTAKE